ncbi:hypothetical protein ACFL59_16510 [Planctomycetota bacterium]
MPTRLCYATVSKTRKRWRVVRLVRKLVYGVAALLKRFLSRSTASRTANTSFVERHNGTDRAQNARKARKTFRFSKRADVHDAASFFVAYSYNFCWPARTLSEDGAGTPAMSTGLADHVWSVSAWVTYAARPA